MLEVLALPPPRIPCRVGTQNRSSSFFIFLCVLTKQTAASQDVSNFHNLASVSFQLVINTPQDHSSSRWGFSQYLVWIRKLKMCRKENHRISQSKYRKIESDVVVSKFVVLCDYFWAFSTCGYR
jgi:hypothetical protein